MSVQNSLQAGFSYFDEVSQIDSSLKTTYTQIDKEKKEATKGAYWFQRAWRGFISSGQEEGALKRFCVKSLSVASVMTAPIFAATTLWGAFEISSILVETMINDTSDSENNYATAGHVPEWVIGALISLYIAMRSIQRSISEVDYQIALELYKNQISNAALSRAQSARLADLAEKDLEDIEAECLFAKPRLSVALALRENV